MTKDFSYLLKYEPCDYEVTFQPCIDGICQEKRYSFVVRMGRMIGTSIPKATIVDVLKCQFKRYNKYLANPRINVNQLIQKYYIQIRNLYEEYPLAKLIEVGRVIGVKETNS